MVGAVGVVELVVRDSDMGDGRGGRLFHREQAFQAINSSIY